jgi:starch-binding outer membrane protein, SusD/RagB family
MVNNYESMKIIQYIFYSTLLVFLMGSCESILDVDPRKEPFSKEDVFSSDATANAALVGVYANLYSNSVGFASGTENSVTALCGMSAAEIQFHMDDVNRSVFQHHSITAANPNIYNLWRGMYFSVYSANSILDGVRESKGMSDEVKRQISGEAYFIRAFTYFYLVNLFGNVPLVLDVDFETTATLNRSSEQSVYQQIISDLDSAYQKVGEKYPTSGRVRCNRACVAALKARVLLYMEEWDAAEIWSSVLIADSNYLLESLGKVFLRTSKEAIWQLAPMGYSQNTNEGALFALQTPPIYGSQPFSLSNGFVESFDTLDLRRESWVGELFDGETLYYFPFKYKIAYGGTASDPAVPLSEFSMVLRLAEQVLIRAEARMHLGKLELALEDVNLIRLRAGLPLIDFGENPIPADSLMDVLIKERKAEFFAEWGHGWLDMKRTENAEAFFANDPNWSSTDAVYPIPQTEIIRNQNLLPQNDGY